MAHGGEFETSLLLHLFPGLVGENRDGSMPEETYNEAPVDLFETGPLSVYRPFDTYSESGAIGAPALATAEKGERLYDGIADELADLLREIHQNTVTE